MKTKGKKLDGIVFTNADPRYAGKLDDLQGGDTTMLVQQVREVMTVNQEMEDESSLRQMRTLRRRYEKWRKGDDIEDCTHKQRYEHV